MAKKVKILVVDDEANIRETFKMTLKVKGYAVDTFEDGPEALQKFSKGNYQVAFLDIKLPKMDGIELLRNIKGLDSAIEVVMMTAYATDVSEAAALKLGALEYLRKPFLMEELYELIDRGLRRREKKEESK
ncbi:MAG: response regulator [Candidatus Saganbacteria bacterium]|nr:response regulator [Candidatus Saganbacteria bacterium]